MVPFPSLPGRSVTPSLRRPFQPRPITLYDIPGSPPRFQTSAVRFRRAPYVRRLPIGKILLDNGAVSEAGLRRALAMQKELGLRLGDLLVQTGEASDTDVTAALGLQYGMGVALPSPRTTPAFDALARHLPLAQVLEFRALPWSRIGSRTTIATTRPDRIDELSAQLPPTLGDCNFAVVSESAFDARLHALHGAAMARAAECRVPEHESCRRLRARGGATMLAAGLVALLALAIAFPAGALRFATLAGLIVLTLNIGLRAAALWSLRQGRRDGGAFCTVRTARAAAAPLPVITILVPLHREPEIATALTKRLSRLDYPRPLLDICIVVEADDQITRDALAQANLPVWMRVIPVPDGQPRTKPRAMNYALNFARGSIIGIYDAEDAPAADQLRRVAARFQTAPLEVACLQGMLDYYNPTRNWMSRCFTIEYANWFRMVLPGIARLGLVVPLGGTTLFFRRSALEAVGAWDAHNVTEDADLGVRLARRGLRTEILDTTTLEEANAHPIAWVKQRSRWMKGYILTWAVHNREPRALWRDLGPKRFFGFQLQFMGAILNTVLMPVLWSTIVLAFGLWHPIRDWLPGGNALPLALFFAVMTAANLGLAMAGCSTPHHRKLRIWTITMELYFALATLAVAKALTEIVLRPFHWDKTVHGSFGGDDSSAEIDTLHNGMATLGETARPGSGATP